MISKTFSKAEKIEYYNHRIRQLRHHFSEWLVDGVLIESSVDLYYFTGLDLSAGRLIITHDKELLLVDGRYFQTAQENSPFSCRLTDDMSVIQVIHEMKAHHMGFDAETTTFAIFDQLQKENSISWKPIEGIGKWLRLYKDKEEIEKMRRSAKLNEEGLRFLSSLLKVGTSEKELALEFEFFVKKKGASGLAFESIIAFSENSAKPHHRSSETKLKADSIVLFDVGVTVDAYQSDATRTVFFGKKHERLKKLYDVVFDSHGAALKICRPGTLIGDLDKAARAVMKKEGVEDLFVHSLGHGIGLETHEFPRLRMGKKFSDLPLKEGMVITIEPGLYVPGLGGIRYEDTIVITKDGYENFYTIGKAT